MRVEVSFLPEVPDGRSRRIFRTLVDLPGVSDVRLCDVYLPVGLSEDQLESIRELFHDPVVQTLVIFNGDRPLPDGWDACIEVAYRPGVTDPVAVTIRDAIARGAPELLPNVVEVRTATQYRLRLAPGAAGTADPEARVNLLSEISRRLHNPLIQDARIIAHPSETLPPEYPGVTDLEAAPITVDTFPIVDMTDAQLMALSQERLLALTLEEMKAIRSYFTRPYVLRAREERGLSPEPTDCELEMLAQTWSEHCKHKIFQARVTYREAGGANPAPETIDGLFKTYIRGTTEELRATRSDILSVFHDNAGVVSFDEELALCFKVETHNSPSALDPYGGAITGIVGVNRDILGTGLAAKPIFNTNVLCFGPPDLPEVPPGLLHPRRVLEGVHHGIVDGGNQSGIPTVAGAFLFDHSYVGKPLVFCGTGGLLPRRIRGREGHAKEILPGDVAVMVGGRIGKDGIHGATFSSLALDETSPVSAVQIGDPITQKRMTDFLLEARDAGLFRALSDNGAGGLSSSLGEMAELSGGVRVFLERCPLKYQGLEPWEIFVSESQERMSVAVQPEHLADFVALGERHGVEATEVGEFTDHGFVEVTYDRQPIALIDLEFLHGGTPQMELQAWWPGAGVPVSSTAAGLRDPAAGNQGLPAVWQQPAALKDDLLALLRDPNIGSRESLIRQYDHEVQGRSAAKPFGGRAADAPTDGALLFPRYDSSQAVAISHGMAPWVGDYDAKLMARYAVDEAVRALIALGAHPDRISALDNFCWPDPVDAPDNPEGPYKMAQLVRACQGLGESCLAYNVPLISGKDSMKNDAVVEGRRISVRPTLLVSAMGIVPKPVAGASTDFKRPGDRIYLLGDPLRPAGAPAADPSAPAGTAPGRPPVLGCSAYERVKLPETDPFVRLRDSLGVPAELDAAAMTSARERYRLVHSALSEGLLSSIHDLSDGGLAVALAESVIGGRLGAQVSLSTRLSLSAAHSGPTPALTPAEALFAEGPSRFLVSVSPDKVERFENLFSGSGITLLGEVTTEEQLEIRIDTEEPDGQASVTVALAELLDAWNGTGFGRPTPTISATDERRSAGSAAGGAPVSDSRRGMPSHVRPVAVVTGYGINADAELGEAFRSVGAPVESVHLESLFSEPRRLQDYGILAFPGGFSYGDHLGSGRALSFLLSRRLGEAIRNFVATGGLIIGICNGFQVLTKLGLLPGSVGGALIYNDHGQFEDSWVTLKPNLGSSSPWLQGLSEIEVPIRHGEGRFYADEASLRSLEASGQVAFRYAGRNPNGSAGEIAGLTDATGRVLGLMPHPEAFLRRENHPLWQAAADTTPPWRLFENGVRAASAEIES